MASIPPLGSLAALTPPPTQNVDSLLKTEDGRKQLAEFLDKLTNKDGNNKSDKSGGGGGGGGGGAGGIDDIINKLMKGEELTPEEIKKLKNFMHSHGNGGNVSMGANSIPSSGLGGGGRIGGG